MKTRQIARKPRKGDGRRRTANMTERVAAYYLTLTNGNGDWLIPEPIRTKGSAKTIIQAFRKHIQSFEADHNVLHAFGGDTRPQNINLLTPAQHREKSKLDKSKTAKAARISKDEEAFRQRLLAKTTGEQPQTKRLTKKGNRPVPGSRNSGWRKPMHGNGVRRERV